MTEPLPPGLYEVLVTEVLAGQLAGIEGRLVATETGVRPAEVADRVALHLSRVVERAIEGVTEEDRVDVAIAVARDLVASLDELVAARSRSLDLAPERPVEPGSVLRSITARRPDGTPDEIDEPLIPLLDTTLLTNAPGEPRVGSQVLAEVASADRIDVVMAALDYVRLRAELPRARLLFVAPIARSWRLCRRPARCAFGPRRPGPRSSFLGLRPGDPRAEPGDVPLRHARAGVRRALVLGKHAWAVIVRRSSSFTAAGLDDLAPGHFDVVIVDEFHHAAARSYERLLDHVAPVELLGLTATPERADGLSLLGRFDGRIAAELRLWDAIDQHRLSPFAYFGIHDGLDLREVPWRRPTGYDFEGLTNLYTASDAWARQAVKEVHPGVDDVRTMRALGFCVSVEHARFMARVFNEAGIAAVAVWGDSPADERQPALRDLVDGRVQVVFSVDLFNEGVDVPVVNYSIVIVRTWCRIQKNQVANHSSTIGSIFTLSIDELSPNISPAPSVDTITTRSTPRTSGSRRTPHRYLLPASATRPGSIECPAARCFASKTITVHALSGGVREATRMSGKSTLVTDRSPTASSGGHECGTPARRACETITNSAVPSVYLACQSQPAPGWGGTSVTTPGNAANAFPSSAATHAS